MREGDEGENYSTGAFEDRGIVDLVRWLAQLERN